MKLASFLITTCVSSGFVAARPAAWQQELAAATDSEWPPSKPGLVGRDSLTALVKRAGGPGPAAHEAAEREATGHETGGDHDTAGFHTAAQGAAAQASGNRLTPGASAVRAGLGPETSVHKTEEQYKEQGERARLQFKPQAPLPWSSDPVTQEWLKNHPEGVHNHWNKEVCRNLDGHRCTSPGPLSMVKYHEPPAGPAFQKHYAEFPSEPPNDPNRSFRSLGKARLHEDGAFHRAFDMSGHFHQDYDSQVPPGPIFNHQDPATVEFLRNHDGSHSPRTWQQHMCKSLDEHGCITTHEMEMVKDPNTGRHHAEIPVGIYKGSTRVRLDEDGTFGPTPPVGVQRDRIHIVRLSSVPYATGTPRPQGGLDGQSHSKTTD